VGRPVLVVPYVGELKDVAQNVMVCWSATREAARAVTDALPLLQRAQKVTVLSANPRGSAQGHGESPGSDIALYLARHGVRAEASRTAAQDVDVGNLILSCAFDAGAGLIVMGAYGHSRVREIVLGGTTRTVLSSMTGPVLLSH
jgi:nucleotide-binding universal stress UspA family protein